MAYIIRLEHGAAVGPKQTKKSTDQTTDRQTDQEEVALPIKMYKNYEEHIATNDWWSESLAYSFMFLVYTYIISGADTGFWVGWGAIILSRKIV